MASPAQCDSEASTRRTTPSGDGASVIITHPEKVLLPDDGITKGDLAAYCDAVAPVMLPHLRGRPITLERYPNGINAEGFIQKSVVRGYPHWLERITAQKRGGRWHHASASDSRVQWIANREHHRPACLAVAGSGLVTTDLRRHRPRPVRGRPRAPARGDIPHVPKDKTYWVPINPEWLKLVYDRMVIGNHGQISIFFTACIVNLKGNGEVDSDYCKQ